MVNLLYKAVAVWQIHLYDQEMNASILCIFHKLAVFGRKLYFELFPTSSGGLLFLFFFLTAIWLRANFQLSDRFRSDICIDFIWDCRLVSLWQLTVALFPENGGSWNFLWIQVPLHWLVLSWQMTEHVSDDTRSLKGLKYSSSDREIKKILILVMIIIIYAFCSVPCSVTFTRTELAIGSNLKWPIITFISEHTVENVWWSHWRLQLVLSQQSAVSFKPHHVFPHFILKSFSIVKTSDGRSKKKGGKKNLMSHFCNINAGHFGRQL